MSSRWAPLSAALCATAVVLAAAAAAAGPHLGVVAGKATAASSALKLYPQSGDELVMRVPVMPGWSPSFVVPPVKSYPSDRAIVAHVGARDSGYSPTMILSVDRLDHGQPAAGYTEKLSARLAQMSERLTETSGEVCGRPAYLMDFTGMRSGGSDSKTQSGMGIVVVPDGGPHAYIAVLQTRNLDSPGYLAQRDALLSGFCIGQ
jgi:hypothetical protein